ncbi:methyl-accepting chemotaxis protein [Pseudomonas sp. nanlin1]
MNLRRLNIAKRTLMCFGLMVIVILAFGAFSLMQLSSVHDEGLRIETDALPGVGTGDDIAMAFAMSRFRSVELIAMPEPAQLETNYTLLKKERQNFAEAIQRYRPLITASDEKALVDNIEQAYAQYIQLSEQVYGLVKANDLAPARLLVKGEMSNVAKQLTDLLSQLEKLNDDSANNSGEVAAAAYGSARSGAFVFIMITVVLTLLLAWRLTLSLAVPLKQAVGAAQTIAQGNLTGAIDTSGSDEPAQLLQSMALMRDNLRNTLQQVAGASSQLSTASSQMTSQMRQSASDLHQQHQEIEMAAAAVTEMSQAVEEVASNAVATSTESKASAKSTQDGQAQLNLTLGSIDALTRNVEEAADQAKALAMRTADITKVLEVIRAVSEQTNLLALNAAIEAARAGDAGRGFAVVADEVRALAQRTGESTREIESMIGSIQQGTKQTLDALQSSTDSAKQTQRQAESASAALGVIAESVLKIDERNTVIASAAEEQAQVAREVDHNLVRIRDLSVNTAAGAQQTDASSQALAGLAVELNGALRRFVM